MMRVKCPTRCSGHDQGQHELPREKFIEAGLPDEEWFSNAWRCGYCDCVYSNEWDDVGRRYVRKQRGYFGGNTLIASGQWEPTDPRNAKVEYSR